MTYEQMYKEAVVHPAKVSEVNIFKQRILTNQNRYKSIESSTGCPWWVVAVIHQMEAGGKFTGHLHNGDPLTGKTINVPKGRPLGTPPFTWEQSATDAIQYMEKTNPLWISLRGKWDFDSSLRKLEAYNGMGYKKRNVPSPYLWSYTQFYTKGKYAFDGKYDPELVSKQPGVCAILKLLGI